VKQHPRYQRDYVWERAIFMPPKDDHGWYCEVTLIHWNPFLRYGIIGSCVRPTRAAAFVGAARHALNAWNAPGSQAEIAAKKALSA